MKKNKKSWPELFFEFFKKNESNIGKIMEAVGCRERWIQGEAFLYFHFKKGMKNFWTDTGKSKSDFFDSESKMVAEFKALAPNFEPKNINFIISDYKKLKEDEFPKKYLIILNYKEDKPTKLGKFLENIEKELQAKFLGKKDYGKVWVKILQII